jgi:hypothetical protein
MSQSCGSGPHSSQCGHLCPLHSGILRLSVLIWSGPGPGHGSSRGLSWQWLPGLQLLAGSLLPLQECLHHGLQLHGPAGRATATPGTRGGWRGRPLWGGGPATLQRGGLGGAGAVQGGGEGGGGGRRAQAEGWRGMPVAGRHLLTLGTQGQRLVSGSFTCLQKPGGQQKRTSEHA